LSKANLVIAVMKSTLEFAAVEAVEGVEEALKGATKGALKEAPEEAPEETAEEGAEEGYGARVESTVRWYLEG
jgi:hypothetical protein